jgi:hypothetical protein
MLKNHFLARCLYFLCTISTEPWKFGIKGLGRVGPRLAMYFFVPSVGKEI